MTAKDPVTTLERDGDVAVILLDSPPVNALSVQVCDGLVAAFEEALTSDASAVVLLCKGRTFIAGADITEFGGRKSGATIYDVQAVIEGASKPVVMALHGTVLGGGLEVALCAHYRIAVMSAQLGLPEVKLGLLPAAGGTQRLPRIVGVQRALEMVSSGQPMTARDALKAGLLDAIVDDYEQLRGHAVTFARNVVAQQLPLIRMRDKDNLLAEAKGDQNLFTTFREANQRRFRGAIAPEYNIRCIEAAVNQSFEEGLATEQTLFMELLGGDQSAAQRYYFFAERQAAKIPDVPDTVAVRPIARVGIVGAGTMGGGIAMAFANAGFSIHLVEQKREALDLGLATIHKNYERTLQRGGLTGAQVAERKAAITGSLSYEDLGDVDLVVEAVFERMDIKKDLFRTLDRVCKPGAILASNTSTLDINEMAAVTSRPQDVIGLHFFSPAHIMKLLEVVRGEKTAKDVIATSMKLAKRLGKVAVLVGVTFGFVGNRMLIVRQDEAEQLLLEGTMPWDIDRALVNFGFPMGPFAMMDMAGLDIGWVESESRGDAIRDVLCEGGRRGQKTGAGYYDYDEKRAATPSKVTEGIIGDFMGRAGKVLRPSSDTEILERCLYPMINEAAKILEEGKAIRASDVDVVWVNGYGWPSHKGGPMAYADMIGLARVVARLSDFERIHGARFTPAKLLVELAESGKTFTNVRG